MVGGGGGVGPLGTEYPIPQLEVYWADTGVTLTLAYKGIVGGILYPVTYVFEATADTLVRRVPVASVPL